MSKYTTEVRFICESAAGLTESKGFDDIDQILDLAIPKVFDFSFPIFDETYRQVLERKILKHYYVREIGAETVGLWKLFLSNRLNEIMPYYNKLYLSELMEINPFYDVDLYTDHSGSGSSVGNGSQNNIRIDNLTQVSEDSGQDVDSGTNTPKNTRYELFSDTPQGALTGVNAESYLTEARKITDDGTGSEYENTRDYGKETTTTNTGTQTNTGDTHSNISTTDTYLDHVYGKRGNVSYSKLLEEYRNTFLNIDLMIINDLGDLFMGLW